MSETVVKVDHVYKDFLLPHERVTSLKSAFTNMFRGAYSKSKQHALKDISFEVQKGEFFGIVGRNGSGKSTLLKILANIYQPTKGSIATQGRLVPFIELGVGFNSELSGRDNVYLNGAMLGFSVKEIDAMYENIVEFAELGRFMDKKLKNYSSGMQVRLAFSLATRAKAEILLIDEVLAVGDAEFQRKCYRYFKLLKREGTTVVFVTHDMDAVREYCDRAMLVESQKMMTIGTSDHVAREYLKLMTPTQSSEDNEQEEDSDRWGTGVCRISSVKIDAINDQKLEFSYSVTALKDCQDPVYGFRIRNSQEQGLIGTNSMILGHKPTPLKKGQKITVRWTIDNIFSEGEYFLDPSVVYEGTLTAADWWDSAVTIVIPKERHSSYLVDPRIEFRED